VAYKRPDAFASKPAYANRSRKVKSHLQTDAQPLASRHPILTAGWAKPLLYDFVLTVQSIVIYSCCEPALLHAENFSACPHHKMRTR